MKPLLAIIGFFLVVNCGKSSEQRTGDDAAAPGDNAGYQGELKGDADPIANVKAVPGGTYLRWAPSLPTIPQAKSPC